MDLNIILTIIGLIVGILSAYLTVFFYRKGKKKKILSISHYTSFYVNSEKNKEIKILYKKRTIKKIICHIYRIRNRGNVCVFQADIPEKAPLEFKSNDGFSIVGAQIWNENESKVSITALDEEFSAFVVNFDYINPNSYFEIQVYGFSEAEDSMPDLHGDVIEGLFVDDGLFIETEDINGWANMAKYMKIAAIACFIFAFLPNSFKTVLLIIIGSLHLVVYILVGLLLSDRYRSLKNA